MVEQVQKFYDRYPYPLAEVKTSSNLNGGTLFSFLDYELRAKGFNGKTFLDAGCGTGHRILDIAKAFSRQLPRLRLIPEKYRTSQATGS